MERTANWKMGVFMTLEEKALERLSELDPSSPEFNYTLNNIGLMLQIAEQVKYDAHLWDDPTEKITVVQKFTEPTVAPTTVIVTTEDEDDGAETAAEEPVPEITFEEAKKKLVQYAQAGVDVGAVLAKLKVTKLSEVPAERYAEMLALAEQEAG